MKPHVVFVSYSHRDERWKDRILLHFTPLRGQFSVDVWDDTRIPLGSEWGTKLEAAVTRADAAVLLISADFLSSEFIREVEVPMLLAREARGNMRLLPIILRPCAWQTVSWLANREVHPARTPSLSSLTSVELEDELATMARLVLRGSAVTPDKPTIDGAREQARDVAEQSIKAARQMHRGTTVTSLVIEGPDGTRFEARDVPASLTGRDLLDMLTRRGALGKAFDVPGTQPVSLDLETSQGNYERLDLDRTLYDQNVSDGGTLHVLAEAQAGCFPLDTLIDTPNGRTVPLGDLRIGDTVESPRTDADESSVAVVEEVIRERATRIIAINEIIRLTPDHGLFCLSRGGRWIPAKRLRLGDFLLLSNRRIMTIRGLALEDLDVEVGNLVLRHPAHTFVANGVVVFGPRRTILGNHAALLKSDQG